MTRRLLIVVVLANAAEMLVLSSLAPVIPTFADRFGFEESGAGLLVAGYGIGAGIMALPAGLLAPRLGPKLSLLAGLAALSAATVWFALAGSLVELQAARIVQGMAGTLSWTGGIAWIALASPPERRASNLGAVIGAAMAGALLGPAVGALADTVGIRAAYLGVAVAVGLLALPVLAEPAASTSAATLRESVSAMRNRSVLAGMALFLVGGVLLGSLTTLGPLELDRLGWSAAGIGVMFLAVAAVEAGLHVGVGRWCDRAGRLTPAAAALAGGTVGSLLLAAPWLGGYWPLAVVLGVTMLFYASCFVPGSALVSDGTLEAGVEPGVGFGLVSLAWAPGYIVGGAAGGQLAESTSPAVTFVTAAAICAVGAALCLRGRRGERRAALLEPA